MRCSYLRRPSKSNSSNPEEETTNYRILQDLNKHNWLLKKLKWGIKTTEKSHKHLMESRARRLPKNISINDGQLKELAVDESSDGKAAATPLSLPVSLPVNLYKQVNGSGLSLNSDGNIASDNINDNMTPDPKDVEVAYNEITKEFNRSLQVSEQVVQYGPYDMEIPVGEDPNNNNERSRMLNIVAERETCIKNHLPLPAPPERTKSAYYYHNSASTSTSSLPGTPDFLNKLNVANMEVQTDDVIIINESNKKLIDYIYSKNINLEKLQTAVEHMEKNNGANKAEVDPNINTNVIMRDQVMQILEACSLYNKEIIAYHAKVLRNVPEVELRIERIKLVYLRRMFEKIFGSVFEELAKSLKFDENSLDSKVPDVVPKTVNNRKRRNSVSVVPPHDNTNNGDLANATDFLSGPVVKKPSLRTQRKCSKPTSLVPYSNNPQYTQTTKVVQLETSYSNSHSPNRMDYMHHQYPCPRPQHVQGIPAENRMPYYNTSARMMEPYAQMQFVREQHIPFQYHSNVANSLNYPHNDPDVTENVHAPYMNVVPLPAQVMSPTDQQSYLRMQVQRNAMRMSNYRGSWNKNVGPNSHNIM